jgi:hypothetical protein
MSSSAEGGGSPSGRSSMKARALKSSAALCGGMLFAMPTAMPEEPFARRLEGCRQDAGSDSLPS